MWFAVILNFSLNLSDARRKTTVGAFIFGRSFLLQPFSLQHDLRRQCAGARITQREEGNDLWKRCLRRFYNESKNFMNFCTRLFAFGVAVVVVSGRKICERGLRTHFICIWYASCVRIRSFTLVNGRRSALLNVAFHRTPGKPKLNFFAAAVATR